MNRQERRRRNKKKGQQRLVGGADLVAGPDRLLELFNGGDYHAALAEGLNMLKEDPDNSDVLSVLGVMHFNRGDLKAASSSLSQCVELDPKNGEAWLNLGLVHCHLRQLSEGIFALEKAQGLYPKDSNIRYNLGNAYFEMGKVDLAAKSYKLAYKLNADHADAHIKIGLIAVRQGRLEEAAKIYEEVLGKFPLNVDVLISLAQVYRELGRTHEAGGLARTALGIKENDAGALYLLALLGNKQELDELVEPMKSVIVAKESQSEDRVLAGFGLSHALDKLGIVEDAFQCLQAANEEKRKLVNINLGDLKVAADLIFKTYSKNAISSFAGSGFTQAAPIFIFGMPRSGTTLVEQILASHSQTFALGECSVLKDSADTFAAFSVLDQKELTRIGQTYITSTRHKKGTLIRTIDKGLDNYFFAGLIHLALPNAIMINCTRDPLDTCFSCYQQLFQQGQAFVYDQGELGWYYCLYRKIIEHWDTVIPGKIMHLAYEDLIAQQKIETERLLNHCQLKWEESCMTFYQTDRSIRTASSEQVRMPLYQTSINKSYKYKPFLSVLIDALGSYAE